MTELRVGVVVVHWRGLQDLLECLRSLALLETRDVEIVIGLNTRDDFDEVAVREACGGVIIAESSENLGYAGGCNLGWRALRGRGLDAVLFLNNDIVVSPDIVRQISDAFAAHPQVGIAGPVVTYYDYPARVWFAGGTINRLFGYTRHIGFRREALPAVGHEVGFASGCAIAARFSVLEHLGGWDASYFHFFDEVDLCERARAAGYASWLVASPLVRHKVSASTGERGSNRFNRRQAYYFSRNRLLFVRRNVTGIGRATAMLAQLLLLLPYESAKAARAGNWLEVRGRVEGVIDGVRGRDGPRDFGPA